MELDICYSKFVSNDGYIFSYLISKLVRFELCMAVNNVFEKKLKIFQISTLFALKLSVIGARTVQGLFQCF